MPRYEIPHIKSPEPGFYYRWLSVDNERLAMHLVGHGDSPGYTLVKGRDVEATKALAIKLGLGESLVDELKNQIRYGFLVLGRIPLAEHDARTRELIQDAHDKRSSAQDEFYDRVASKHVRPFIRSEEEMEDRRAFSKRDPNSRVSMARSSQAASAPAAE